MTWHIVLAEWSQWFWPLAINHLWQATLFALLVWAAMLLLRRAYPLARHAAWSLALLKFLLPATLLAWTFGKLGLQFSRVEKVAAEFSIEALTLFETAEPLASADPATTHNELFCLLTLFWLAGAVAVFLLWQTRRWRLVRRLGADSAEATGRALEIFAGLKQQLGLTARIPLIVSAKIAEPGLLGILRPKIVLPLGLIERLNEDELSAVLVHELIHVKQRDNLLSTIQMIVCCLFWFHPLVWLIDRKLLGERELMCDEKVIRFGGTAESYAAGLWKVVQHGLGWPVAGMSRATGSNLKRRIKLMLNTKLGTEKTFLVRLLAGAVLSSLFVVAVATGLQARSKALAAPMFINATNTNQVNFPVAFENSDEFPLVITQATMSLGEAGQMKSKGVLPNGQTVELTHKGEDVRQAILEVRLQAQGNRRISRLAIELKNAPVWGEESFTVVSQVTVSENLENNSAVEKAGVIEEQGSFRLKAPWLMEEKELMNHIWDFRLRLTGIQLEDEKEMQWLTAEKGKVHTRMRMMLLGAPKKKVAMKLPPAEPQQEEVQPMNAQTRSQEQSVQTQQGPVYDPRPKILHHERAHYTKEAREQKIEGRVVLSLMFGADGVIRDIKVESGLPYGLTEAAIEAAKAVRFEPATKDGQPVSVLSKLQYSFSLYDSGGKKQ